MASEKHATRTKLPRGLDPHNENQVAKQLCYQIPSSKDSLYFILRGLGLPPAGEPDTTPRVEIDAKEYPTLWRTLDRLGIPHNGKQMVIKAESSSAKEERRTSRRRSSKGAIKVRASVEATPEQKPEMRRRLSEVSQPEPGPPEIHDARLSLTEGAQPAVAAFIGPLPEDRPPPWRASSAPKLSRARTKELTDRLTVSKWPPRKPYSAKNLLDELKKVQQQQKARSTPAAAAMSFEDQRLYCEDLAKPVPKPPRYRQRHRCRKAYSPVMVATQRASVQRLSRPRSAPLPGITGLAAALEPVSRDAEVGSAAQTRGQRLSLSSPASEGSCVQRPVTPLGQTLQLEVPSAPKTPGRWLLEAMKRKAAAARMAQDTEATSETPT